MVTGHAGIQRGGHFGSYSFGDRTDALGEQFTVVGDYGERKGYADQGVEDAEDAADERCGKDVAVTYRIYKFKINLVNCNRRLINY